MSELEDLVTISREVGRDPEWVLAGGGNTSVKVQGVLSVKASGTALADVSESGFVRIDLERLDRIWSANYPQEPKEREAQALADLMDSRLPGEENKRPSVETLMHAMLPFTFVVHTHPGLVNGITCGNDGEKAVRKVFGDDVLWVPIVNPGYILAQTLRAAITSFTSAHGAAPQIILLQNHGLVVAANSIDEIRTLQDGIVASIRHHVDRYPDFSPVAVPRPVAQAAEAAVRDALGVPDAKFFTNAEVARFAADRDALAPLMSPFSPDHIVYAGVEPLIVPPSGEGAGSITADQVRVPADAYRKRLGVTPKIVVFLGVGAVATGHGVKSVMTAEALFLDAIKVAVYARSFGGPHFLPEDQVAFIRTWEVETYRAKLSLTDTGHT